MELLFLDPVASPLPVSVMLFTEMSEHRTNVIVGEHPPVIDEGSYPLSPGSFRHTASPLNPNQALGKGSAKLKSSSRSPKRKRSSRRLQLSVLVVDDVADVTEMIGLFLKHAGYEVTTADSAATALQMANERAFDLIISDIGMPEMNGYELAEALRGLSDYQGTPIIAVTGYSEYDDRARALRAGFNAHMTKPIDPSDLLNLINELMA